MATAGAGGRRGVDPHGGQMLLLQGGDEIGRHRVYPHQYEAALELLVISRHRVHPHQYESTPTSMSPAPPVSATTGSTPTSMRPPLSSWSNRNQGPVKRQRATRSAATGMSPHPQLGKVYVLVSQRSKWALGRGAEDVW